MLTNKWFMGLGLVAGLAGCDGLGLWSDDGEPNGATTAGPSGNNGGSDGFGGSSGGGFSERPTRLPETPVRAATTPPAISGGTLSVSPSGSHAVAADPDRDRLYVVNLSDYSSKSVQLASGAEPGRIVFDTDGRAHVILRGTGQVARLNVTKPHDFETHAVCALPRGIAYSRQEDAVIVACASGDVIRLSPSNHAEVERAFVDTDLRDVIVDRDGKVLVSRYRSAELIELSATNTVAKRMRPAARSAFRFTMDSGNPVTMLPALGWRALPTSDGKVLMLHQQAQEDEVQPSEGGYGGGGGCSSISQPAVSIVTGGAVDKERSFALGGASLAVDAALSPDGDWLAVANPGGYLRGGETLVVYSAVTEDNSLFPPIDGGTEVEAEPTSCASMLVSTGYESQTTAIAFAPNGHLIAQSREPALLHVYKLTSQDAGWDGGIPWPSLEEVLEIALDGSSVADSGHDLFHADVGGGITCASCHGELTDDAHVWTFGGIGPRRTQSMRGGLKGTEPFHWDGDMLTFNHLVADVLTGRMSGFEVDKPNADAMLSWIDSQPALRLPVKDAGAVARGKALFQSVEVGCATCHAGKATTNNLSFDVGTGGTFQVPTLHGLGLRAPYMHNGCAKTLEQRFQPGCGGGDKHGKTSQLSPTQIKDLTTYLKSL